MSPEEVREIQDAAQGLAELVIEVIKVTGVMGRGLHAQGRAQSGVMDPVLEEKGGRTV